MSRCADLGHGSALRRAAATLTAAGLMLAGLATPTAQADPPDEAPVVVITAPVVDLHTGTATMDGAVAAEDTDDGTRVRLDSSVLFPKDSARLRPKAHDTINALATHLRRGGPGKITVTGHTDDLGSAARGLRLSKRRAAAVARQLDKLLGPNWPQIKIIGKGEADPAVPNTNERNRQLNRRVIVTIKR